MLTVKTRSGDLNHSNSTSPSGCAEISGWMMPRGNAFKKVAAFSNVVSSTGLAPAVVHSRLPVAAQTLASSLKDFAFAVSIT